MLKYVFCVAALFFDNTYSFCAPGCNDNLIGNSICNQECNNIDCNYDAGDCSIYLRGNYFEPEFESHNFSVQSSNSFNSGSCNLTTCPNIFFDDCNTLQKHTNKWCNYDNDDHENDFCCAKYHTDCCEYDTLYVFLASLSFFIVVICCGYGTFKMFIDCCGD